MTNTQIPSDVTKAFADMARRFLAAATVDQTLHRIVHLAVETVEGCDYAGVSIVERDGRISTPAATHDVVARCDELQYSFREGPCVSAIWHQQTFESADLSLERRWPKWAPKAKELGAASIVSFRLFVEAGTLGALNLYSATPEGFDEVDRETGLVFAAHAAVAISGAQTRERLDFATVVAKATGMLMERRGITSEQALEVLRRAAYRTNAKLQDVAARVVDRRGPQI